MGKKNKGSSASRSSGGLWRSLMCCISPREPTDSPTLPQHNGTGFTHPPPTVLDSIPLVTSDVHLENKHPPSDNPSNERNASSESETAGLLGSNSKCNDGGVAARVTNTDTHKCIDPSTPTASEHIQSPTGSGDCTRQIAHPIVANADQFRVTDPARTSSRSSSKSSRTADDLPVAEATTTWQHTPPQNQVITQVPQEVPVNSVPNIPSVVSPTTCSSQQASTPPTRPVTISSLDASPSSQTNCDEGITYTSEQAQYMQQEQELQAELMRTVGINYSPYPPANLLQPPSEKDQHRKCLVMDLDETLVHSSFKQITEPDFIVPIEIDDRIHEVYVKKRPCVDEFLKAMSELFECVLFTASLAKYADPVSDYLDPTGKIFGRRRLVREHCVHHNGSYIKDIGRIGRALPNTLLLDNCNLSYMFQPDNGIPITSWFDDMEDTELLSLIEPLRVIASAENVYEGVKAIGGAQYFPYYQKRPDMWQQAISQGIYNQQFHYYGGYGVPHYGAYSTRLTQATVPYSTSTQQESEDEQMDVEVATVQPRSNTYTSQAPGADGERLDSAYASPQNQGGLASIITQVDAKGTQVVPTGQDGLNASN